MQQQDIHRSFKYFWHSEPQPEKIKGKQQPRVYLVDQQNQHVQE